MSGRLDRIPADVARRRSHYVLRVLPADPPARELVVRATLSGGRPFEFTLDVRRYRVVAIEAESSTRWSNEPGAAVGGLIEVVTEQDLTRLTVSRRYAADGTRKIPIYEVLDAVEPPDPATERLLYVTGWSEARGLYSTLGAGPC